MRQLFSYDFVLVFVIQKTGSGNNLNARVLCIVSCYWILQNLNWNKKF